MNFINTKKEQFLGFDYFFHHTTPTKEFFDYRIHKKEISKYYENYGFSVSMAYADYYSRMFYRDYSDKFMSGDVYYYYVLPALNRYDFINSYMDKNYLDRVFPDFNKPRVLIKNVNGHFFDSSNIGISKAEAIQIALDNNIDYIAKPSVESGCGLGVRLIKHNDLTVELLENVFDSYGGINFNLQEKVCQCRALAQLNPSSLNTFRIYTYRTLLGEVVHLVTSIRFGGVGSFIDNASAGGGFCHVYDDGSLDSRIFRFRSLDQPSLYEYFGRDSIVIPNYSDVLKFAKKLHEQVPYFDLVGWDIGIDSNENPIFIEMNLKAEVDHAQVAGGLFLGDYLDEVMERTIKCHKDYRNSVEISYDNGSILMMKV